MIRRIVAIAELNERPDAAAATRARAAMGDEDNAWVLEQWRRRHILVADLTVIVYADDADGRPLVLRRVLDEIWLERDAFPDVEVQVADIAPMEFGELTRELVAHGVAADEFALRTSYVHVELGDRLLAALEQT